MVEIIVGILVVAVIVFAPWIVGKIGGCDNDAADAWYEGACVIFLVSMIVVGLYGIGGLVMEAVR